ncbi:PPE family protein [Mycobacterium haemophilum]|uniref:PPE family domain-containing protein n=1 Tax=Mycobacterium haemophilum TaxID=29311 RepID=A0A0I9VIX3_9MYCO|nr:PPE family protein [Mycobacterium haemophilum]KLO33716.1 hypothetical protein ABH39_00630 [Mycobacterium haemophilum]KLO39243.1 hypothetical protein ABH38_00630 [Mycobacterium haemophilum]KLO45549.1 hypothetical protein ABH37_00630 [Mycobacterium haemophilum]KLO56701.1 hypothetical protein ABH36_00630 [Mycobacterium haemophilum]
MLGEPLWSSLPPEVPSTLLSTGPGPGPLLASAQALRALSITQASTAEELAQTMGDVSSGAWQGPSADDCVAAHLPHQAWLEQTAVDFAQAADQHEVAATAYMSALTAMPTMGELAANHVAHAVLTGTNIFGVNAIPIAANEADYVRMWGQAATTMEIYQAVSTAALASIPPITSAPVIVQSGVGAASNLGAIATQPGAVVIGAIWELLSEALTAIWDVIGLLMEDLWELGGGVEIALFLEKLIDFIGWLVETPEALVAVVMLDSTVGVGLAGGVAPTSVVSTGVSLPLGVGIPGSVNYLSQVEADFVNTTTADGLTTSNNNEASTKLHVPPSNVVSAVAVSDHGGGMVGFAGTAPSPTAAGASGLATLDSGFNGSPQVPLLPTTWEVSMSSG